MKYPTDRFLVALPRRDWELTEREKLGMQDPGFALHLSDVNNNTKHRRETMKRRREVFSFIRKKKTWMNRDTKHRYDVPSYSKACNVSRHDITSTSLARTLSMISCNEYFLRFLCFDDISLEDDEWFPESVASSSRDPSYGHYKRYTEDDQIVGWK